MRIHTPLVFAPLLLVACADSSDDDSVSSGSLDGDGRLTLEVTDAPFLHDMVESAIVRVDLVRAHASDSTESGWHTIHEGPPLGFDLLDLQNGLTRTLVSLADVPAGRYDKVRLRVVDASMLLVNGNFYSTADGNLHLTSTVTSGMQVRIDPPLVIQDGFSRTILLDFDLSKTFLPVPANDPLNARTVQLHKGVRAVNLSESGELRGTVTTDGGATLVEDATVRVLPPGVTDLDDAVATTGSDENGSWAVLGLLPGSYDVHAESGDRDARVDGVQVLVGSATRVDLDLTD